MLHFKFRDKGFHAKLQSKDQIFFVDHRLGKEIPMHHFLGRPVVPMINDGKDDERNLSWVKDEVHIQKDGDLVSETSRGGLSSLPLLNLWLFTKVPLLDFVSCTQISCVH